jgi:curved DNA-binding protein CbpA
MREAHLHHQLIDSLLDFHRRKGAGVILVEAGTAKKQLVIRGGKLAFAESNQADEHLARILVTQRVIQRQDLPKISALMKEGKSSDEAIFSACHVSAEALASGAREQAITILSSLLAWPDGEVHVYPGEAFPNRAMNLSAALPEFILETVRRAVSVGKIPDSMKAVQGAVRAMETGRAARAEIPLDRTECYACSLVSGDVRIETVLPVLEAVDPKPLKLLQRLLMLGFIKLEDTSQEKGGPPPLADVDSESPAGELEDMLRRVEVAGNYAILGVPADATQDQIKDAYYELARRFHPDHFQSAEMGPHQAKAQRLFTYITGAYTILSDPAARVSYDYERTKQASPVESAKSAGSPDKAKMVEMLFKSARLHLSKQEYEKAIAQFRECVWLNPTEAKYHHFLGIAQSELPRFRKEAEKNLLKAVELNGSSVESRLALGKLYIKANLAKRAQLQFEEVLRWDPNNPEAIRLLAGEDRECNGAGQRY